MNTNIQPIPILSMRIFCCQVQMWPILNLPLRVMTWTMEAGFGLLIMPSMDVRIGTSLTVNFAVVHLSPRAPTKRLNGVLT